MEDGSSCIMFGIQLLAVLVGGGVGRMAASSIMFGIQLLAVMVVVVWGGWQQLYYVWNTAVSSDGGGGVWRMAAIVLCLEYSCWQ